MILNKFLNKKIVFAASLVALLFAGSVINQALAQDKTPVTDDQVNEVARQLYCPVCENIPLDVCPTQACAQWRALIKEKLEAGWSVEQIKQYFAVQYGDRVLGEPPRKGLNWLVYILPPIMILGGALLLGWIIKGMRLPKKTTGSIPGKEDYSSSGDEYISQIEEELKKRKE